MWLRLPIVALTANAFDEDIRHSLAAGMNAHLAKPLDPALLYQTLAELIGRREGRPEKKCRGSAMTGKQVIAATLLVLAAACNLVGPGCGKAPGRQQLGGSGGRRRPR
jgi:DNA-binding response OmpR family regulator